MRFKEIIFEDPIMNVDLKSLSDIVKVNEGLKEAIKEGHEIMINCKSALYIDPKQMKVIRQKQNEI